MLEGRKPSCLGRQRRVRDAVLGHHADQTNVGPLGYD